MNTQMVIADNSIDYAAKEVGPVVVALLWLLCVGGATAAGIIICGWRGVRSMAYSTFHGKVQIVCK